MLVRLKQNYFSHVSMWNFFWNIRNRHLDLTNSTPNFQRALAGALDLRCYHMFILWLNKEIPSWKTEYWCLTFTKPLFHFEWQIPPRHLLRWFCAYIGYGGRAAAVWTISEPMCGGPVAAVDQVRVRVLPICIGLLRAKGASETYLPKDYTWATK